MVILLNNHGIKPVYWCCLPTWRAWGWPGRCCGSCCACRLQCVSRKQCFQTSASRWWRRWRTASSSTSSRKARPRIEHRRICSFLQRVPKGSHFNKWVLRGIEVVEVGDNFRGTFRIPGIAEGLHHRLILYICIYNRYIECYSVGYTHRLILYIYYIDIISAHF